MAKIDERVVKSVREQVAAGATIRSVAAGTGLSYSSVSRIARREAWSHIDG